MPGSDVEAPAVNVSTSFARGNGHERFVVNIDVMTEQGTSPRTVMVDRLRALALDIETGAV